ncbi:MAG TPA: response regulator [Bradyrhizobium sp.]
MTERTKTAELQQRVRAFEEQLRAGETAGGIATFELNLDTRRWVWTSQAASVFGFGPEKPEQTLAQWEQAVFFDDVPKIHAAIEAVSSNGGRFYVEFRVRRQGESLRWIVARGDIPSQATSARLVRGAIYDISERKALEARLLALNETLEARVIEAREESKVLDTLNATGIAVAAEHDLQRLVQMVTDAGVELSHAQFGAFFYNVLDEKGESYTLYTISGAPREAFAKFPMPRNTAIFEPTFRGTGTMRSADILADPRYGKNSPHNGMPRGHLPVRSYLAVPVVSRPGEVLGGLFFGHAQPGVFTARAERLVTGLAAQAAVAIDNARLYDASKREIAARARAEQELQKLNQTLEQRAEERARQLAASTAKLQDTEQRFKLLVEGVTDYAIFMLDPNGHIINWNPGAERAKGYKREEVIGRHFSTFYTEEDRKAEIPLKALSIAAQTGKYEAEGWRVRKDESKFWASVVINAIRDAKGEIIGFAKITRDLTERRAAEERAQQAQKMEGIGQLTGGVAHDFNNLLTIILGNLETLQRNLNVPAIDVQALKRSVDNAMTGARRAESLTQRLLAFSRQQPLDPKPLDLGRLVTGMSDLLRRTLGEQVTVETVLGGGLWKALADPNQLELAIINLAVNARDAMPQGGRLTLETANVYLDERYAVGQIEVIPGQYVMLAVTDTGTGMTPEVKAKAFDPFFTTKDVGHGTGLGLSQVYGFVKQSRGHIKIYSEVGEGTTIKLYMPRAHAAADVADEESTQPLARGSTGETILVVEDDAGVRAYTCDTLRALGYVVVEAETGRTALHLLEANPHIRLLFTDIGLPGGMNGRQLADEARRRRQDLKVLFTTGYARNAIIHGGRLDPGVELITKPFSQAALASKLRDIFDAMTPARRVLLVEDEVLIQMLAIEYLEDGGFQVDAAGTATDAMNKLARVPGGFDAVIIDIGLPDRRGDVLLRELRALYPTLPIVLATGHNPLELRNRFKDQSKLSIVAKPYTAEALIAALSRLDVR